MPSIIHFTSLLFPEKYTFILCLNCSSKDCGESGIKSWDGKDKNSTFLMKQTHGSDFHKYSTNRNSIGSQGTIYHEDFSICTRGYILFVLTRISDDFKVTAESLS